MSNNLKMVMGYYRCGKATQLPFKSTIYELASTYLLLSTPAQILEPALGTIPSQNALGRKSVDKCEMVTLFKILSHKPQL